MAAGGIFIANKKPIGRRQALIQSRGCIMIKIFGGLAAGAAAMMLAPSIMSVLAGVFKPVAKTLIKGGLLAIESAKQAAHKAEAAVASSVEAIEDLTAEARAEIAESQKVQVRKTKKQEA
jgi:hypothetical protein